MRLSSINNQVIVLNFSSARRSYIRVSTIKINSRTDLSFDFVSNDVRPIKKSKGLRIAEWKLFLITCWRSSSSSFSSGLSTELHFYSMHFYRTIEWHPPTTTWAWERTQRSRISSSKSMIFKNWGPAWNHWTITDHTVPPKYRQFHCCRRAPILIGKRTVLVVVLKDKRRWGPLRSFPFG